jgi:hypothetical protein
MRPIGFFSALAGVCCGTGIFPGLRRNSSWRVVWHLVLMSLLCSSLIGLRVCGELRRAWAGAAERCVAEFGPRLRFSAAGARPERDPERPRFIALPKSGLLVYTAEAAKIDFPAEALSVNDYLVVWSRRFLAVAVRLDANKWDVQLMLPGPRTVVRRLERDGIPAFFNGELAGNTPAGSWPFSDVPPIDVTWLLRTIGTIFIVSWFLGEWFGIFMAGVFCTGVFAIFSRISGAARLRGLTGLEYWRIGVYAGFPGMLIGAVAEALDLPFLTYMMVYVPALVIYWLPAALACSAEPPPPGEGNSPEV